MRIFFIAAAVVLTATCADAQVKNVPVDTNQFLVQPTDTATNIFSGTARYLSRVVANTIDNNGFVKTLNNLLGRTPDPKQRTQFGSNLPLPTDYPSTRYKNSFASPVLPTTMQFGGSFPGTGR